MGSDAAPLIAVVVASLIAVLLLFLYAIAKLQERGRNPHWAEEVYLCFGGVAARDAAEATAAQVEAYFAAGGSAHGYGRVADGRIIGAAPTRVGLGGLTSAAWPCATPPTPVGVWLFGAKPGRGTPDVIPFSCAHWFQPA